MILIPAIDLMSGRVVRLARGDYARVTLYEVSAVEYARRWERDGACELHVVDLDGARSGKVQNLAVLKEIRTAVRIPIEFGGGVRELETVESILKLGVERVVLGTKALDEAFLTQATTSFPGRIAVSLDTKEGLVQTQGWLTQTRLTPADAFRFLEKAGIERVIYTDILRDGMLKGPNTEWIQSVAGSTRLKIVASGGVASVDDLKRLQRLRLPNLIGVIVGKALYEKKFTIREANAILEEA